MLNSVKLIYPIIRPLSTVPNHILRPIYMDYQATSPMDPRVLDAMLPHMTHCVGNAHSRTHFYGWESEQAVEQAREQVAKLINANPQEIIFTSGATESNNLSLKGVAHFYGKKRKHIITTQIEHKCVLDSCRVLESEGFQVSYLPVKSNGIIDLEVLESAMSDKTCLVSIMGVHNEIGVIQPMRQIGELCRKNKIFYHCDAAQTVGKIPVDVRADKIDLLSISGHKIYGPKGIGALFVNRAQRVRLQPQINGGGQERGLRSGTLPVSLVVGLGEAAKVCMEEMEYDYEHVSRLSGVLIDGLFSRLDKLIRNGDPHMTYPGCVNISFSYVEGESLLMAIKDVAVSSGSACTSSTLEPSYVLRGLAASEENSHSSVRFGIGRYTTLAQVEYTVDLIVEKVVKLREMSPLWEMVLEGIDLSTIKWTH